MYIYLYIYIYTLKPIILQRDAEKLSPVQGDNLRNNERLLEWMRQIARRMKGCSMNRLPQAWVQHGVLDEVSIPNTTKIANLDSNITSFEVYLSSEEVEKIGNAFPKAQFSGNRTQHMSFTYQYVSIPLKTKS